MYTLEIFTLDRHDMDRLKCTLVVLACFLTAPAVHGQTFKTFDEVDYVTVQDFSVFQAIWDKAETQNTRIALFGDSQETSPGGAGAVFIPSLNYEFYQHFGKVGESFVAPSFSSYGGGRPAAEWLLQGSPGSSNGSRPGTLSSSELLPGTSSRIFTSDAFGQNTLLNTENTNVSGGGIPGSTGALWKPEDQVTATVFGVTREGSDEFSWRASPINGNSPNFFQPNSASGTTSLGLDAPSGQILSQNIGLLPSDGLSRQQLIVNGAGDSGAELLGVRFENSSTPGGVSIQDFSAGGYKTDSFLENHSDAGRQLAAFGEWDAVLLHTGANDAYSGFGASAEEFQSNVVEFIDAARSDQWLDNPDQKFILVTDPYREGGSASQDAEFDQYAGAIAELALSDPNILAINSRRLTEELGWTEGNTSEFLSDIVHYTPEGARLLASVEAQLILTGGPPVSVPEPSCVYPILCAVAFLKMRRRR